MNQITPVVRTLRNLLCTLGMYLLSLHFLTANAQEESPEDAAEKEKAIVLELDYRSNACAANMEIEYFQRAENARVNSVLSNEDCAASSGTYTIQVRIRDAAGQTQNIEFSETWSRDDNTTIESSKDYFIGDNVDLVRVRSRGLKCRCSVVESGDSAEPEEN